MQRLTNSASPVWAAVRSARPPGRSWLLGLPWAAAAVAAALAVLLIQPPGTATAGHGQPGNQAERITFTYLGLKVDDAARVVMTGGVPASNVYAAGEIMAGNILRKGYIAGIGMTIGTVFGRIAGEGAARYAAR